MPAALGGEDRPDFRPGIRIAVLPFDNESVSDRERLEPFRKGIADALVADLSREQRLRPVERTRMEAVLSELNLSASGLVDAKSAQELGRILGVRALVLGSFSAVGETVRIDARIADAETGSILGAGEASGETKDFFNLEQTLAARIVEGFRAIAPGTEEKAGSRSATGAGAGMAGSAGGGRPQRLAVFPLEDLGERSGPGRWGEEMAACLTKGFSGGRNVEIIDRKRLGAILRELASGAGGQGGGGTAARKTCEIAGADGLVLGSFLLFEGRIRVHVRLVKTETGEVVAAVRAEGKAGDRSSLAEGLAADLLAAGK